MFEPQPVVHFEAIEIPWECFKRPLSPTPDEQPPPVKKLKIISQETVRHGMSATTTKTTTTTGARVVLRPLVLKRPQSTIQSTAGNFFFIFS